MISTFKFREVLFIITKTGNNTNTHQEDDKPTLAYSYNGI